MQKLVSLIPLLALAASASLLAAPEDRTAKAVKAHCESLAGQEVSVETTHVAPVRNAGGETCSIFYAHTFDTGENISAGSILVAVKKAEHDAFVDKFGATPDVAAGRRVRNRETKRLTGTLKLTSKKVPFIDLTDGGATEALVAEASAQKETSSPAKKLREKTDRKIKR